MVTLKQIVVNAPPHLREALHALTDHRLLTRCAALHRTVVVRRRHQPTVDYVARRTAGGRTRREIIRYLKRFLAREIYQRVMADFRMRRHVTQAA